MGDRVEEIFVVRDVIAHNQLWAMECGWILDDLQFENKPERLPGYGDRKLERVMNPETRRTRLLNLDVFPTRIHAGTATVVLKECVALFRFLMSKAPDRFAFLGAEHVLIGKDQYVPLFQWVDDLPT